MKSLHSTTWQATKLGNVVSFKTGKLNSNAATPNGPYPFFTCSPTTLRTNSCSFDTECVLMAGNNASGVYTVKYFNGKFDAYQRTYIIRSFDDKCLLNRFLYYALQTKLEILKSISTGAATKFLTLGILKDIEVALPPLPTQRKIAAILSTYDDLIDNNTRRIKILEEMAQTIYREWFVNFRFPGHEKVKMVESELGMIPEGWGVSNLGKLVDFVRGTEPGSKNYFETLDEGRVPFLRVGDLSSRGSQTFIDESQAERKMLTNEDIAITLDGSVGIVRIGLFGAYSSGIRKVVPHDRNVTGWAHLYCLLKSDHIQSIIQAHARGTTIQHAGSAVDHMKFALAPAFVITEFENSVAPALKQVLTLSKQIDLVRKSRDLLLPKLISGKLDVEKLDIDVGNTTETSGSSEAKR